MKLTLKTVDVLIIGAGITGLRAALEASERKQTVMVLSKGPRCSWGISGFNAPIGALDNEELYRNDILKSGCGINDKALVELLVTSSIDEVRFLESKGMSFDRKNNDEYDLLQPLGCSVPRLVHKASVTGLTAEKLFMAELAERNVELMDGVTVLDLLVSDGKVYGALGISSAQELICFCAKAVVMAAGGCGHIFPVSTYPEGLHGDSYGMMIRAGCEMVDMEFIQFEPCCLVEPESLRGKGMSTTMMAAGAKLINSDGEAFLERYIPRDRKIQKSELSRAIYAEKKRTGGRPILYDLTALSDEDINAHSIFASTFKKMGYDPTQVPIEIYPAAHTYLGGAKVDANCASSVSGLFSAGEAMGGLHGANRIGGCAGAETFVFGKVAGRSAAEYATANAGAKDIAEKLALDILNSNASESSASEQELKCMEDTLQAIVVDKLSIIRDAEGLEEAYHTADEIFNTASTLSKNTVEAILKINKLENIASLICAMAKASLRREESRGVFFRSDFPKQDDERFLSSIVYQKSGSHTKLSEISRK